MRNFIALILGILCMTHGVAYAETRLDILPTYRQDRFTWNKAGLNDFPNVLSELKWENLRIQGVKGVLRHDMGRRYFLEATGSVGWIYFGNNQDSDYDENNRQAEFSRSNNNGSAGTVFDGSLAVGWKVQENKAQRTSFLGGYALNRQSLTMRNLYQTIPADGPYPGLDAGYKAMWNGPWLGLEHERQVSKRTRLLMRLEYHMSDYRGEAYWNLRSDLAQPVTNNHWGQGRGTVVSLGLDHAAGPRWTLGAQIDYTSFMTFPGTDQVNFAGGEKTQIRLNEVTWDSWAFRLKATYRF